MLCSKCKIFSIHLPNYDSYLCEFGHVLCARCSPKPENQCNICKGRIIRRAEVLIEGVPKTVFHRTPAEDYVNKTYDARSDVGVNINFESDEDWSRIFDFSEFKEFEGNNLALSTSNLLDFQVSELSGKQISTGNDFPDSNIKLLATKRSDCQFRTPSNESIGIQETIGSRDDPKDHYLRTLSGNVSPSFDPMRDYYERTAHVDTIQEYYKRPNLLISTKSSSKMDIMGGDSSDSSTVIQHLTEFRKATNYVSPFNVNAYKINDIETMFEPAIITTSKPKLYPGIPHNSETFKNPNDQKDISYQGTFKHNNGNNNVETMINFSKTPSTEFQNITADKTSTEENDYDTTPVSNDTNRKKVNSSQQILLREKLRHQVYSQFDTTPKPPKNVFMVKGSPNLQEMPSSHYKDLNVTSGGGYLTDTINSEVERVIRNLSSLNTLPSNASLKRDEIVKQSKEILRQRIMDEVYSRFEGTSKITHENCQINTSKIPNEISKPQLNVCSKLDEGVASDQCCSYHQNAEDEMSELLSRTESKSVGMSTESYPKLNPDLSAILSTKSYNENSNSVHYIEKHAPTLENSTKPSTTLYTNIGSASVQENSEEKNQKSNVNSLIKSRDDEEEVPEVSPNLPIGAFQEQIEQGSEVHNFQLETNTDNIEGEHNKIANEVKEQDMDIFFFHQHPTYPFPTPFMTPNRDENIAKKLIDDLKNDLKKSSELALLDMNTFLEYIKMKFPKISLNQLKDIIVNIPLEGHLDQETSDLQTINNPTPVTFSTDESFIRPVSSDILQDSETPDHPVDLSTISAITAWRAYFCPPSNLHSNPAPQVRAISHFEAMPIVDGISKDIRAAAELHLARNPITCPITACQKLIFVSEFSKHIKMDHVKIPVETLTPGKCRNIFLDPRSNDFGVNKCHVLYLVTDKIRDLGSKEFKDYLPLLVMATKVSLLQLICPLYTTQEMLNKSQNYLMIWLTGLCSHDLPVYFSLTAWHRYSPRPKCHMVHAGRIYSIRDKHDELSVFNSGNAMLLSQNQVHLLTNNGKDMIELQVTVH